MIDVKVIPITPKNEEPISIPAPHERTDDIAMISRAGSAILVM